MAGFRFQSRTSCIRFFCVAWRRGALALAIALPISSIAQTDDDPTPVDELYAGAEAVQRLGISLGRADLTVQVKYDLPAVGVLQARGVVEAIAGLVGGCAEGTLDLLDTSAKDALSPCVIDVRTLPERLRNRQKLAQATVDVAIEFYRLQLKALSDEFFDGVVCAPGKKACQEDKSKREQVREWWNKNGLIAIQLLDRLGREHVKLSRRSTEAGVREARDYLHSRLKLLLQREDIRLVLRHLSGVAGGSDFQLLLNNPDNRTEALDALGRISVWLQKESSERFAKVLQEQTADQLLETLMDLPPKRWTSVLSTNGVQEDDQTDDDARARLEDLDRASFDAAVDSLKTLLSTMEKGALSLDYLVEQFQENRRALDQIVRFGEAAAAMPAAQMTRGACKAPAFELPSDPARFAKPRKLDKHVIKKALDGIERFVEACVHEGKPLDLVAALSNGAPPAPDPVQVWQAICSLSEASSLSEAKRTDANSAVLKRAEAALPDEITGLLEVPNTNLCEQIKELPSNLEAARLHIAAEIDAAIDTEKDTIRKKYKAAEAALVAMTRDRIAEIGESVADTVHESRVIAWAAEMFQDPEIALFGQGCVTEGPGLGYALVLETPRLRMEGDRLHLAAGGRLELCRIAKWQKTNDEERKTIKAHATFAVARLKSERSIDITTLAKIKDPGELKNALREAAQISFSGGIEVDPGSLMDLARERLPLVLQSELKNAEVALKIATRTEDTQRIKARIVALTKKIEEATFTEDELKAEIARYFGEMLMSLLPQDLAIGIRAVMTAGADLNDAERKSGFTVELRDDAVLVTAQIEVFGKPAPICLAVPLGAVAPASIRKCVALKDVDKLVQMAQRELSRILVEGLGAKADELLRPLIGTGLGSDLIGYLEAEGLCAGRAMGLTLGLSGARICIDPAVLVRASGGDTILEPDDFDCARTRRNGAEATQEGPDADGCVLRLEADYSDSDFSNARITLPRLNVARIAARQFGETALGVFTLTPLLEGLADDIPCATPQATPGVRLSFAESFAVSGELGAFCWRNGRFEYEVEPRALFVLELPASGLRLTVGGKDVREMRDARGIEVIARIEPSGASDRMGLRRKVDEILIVIEFTAQGPEITIPDVRKNEDFYQAVRGYGQSYLPTGVRIDRIGIARNGLDLKLSGIRKGLSLKLAELIDPDRLARRLDQIRSRVLTFSAQACAPVKATVALMMIDRLSEPTGAERTALSVCQPDDPFDWYRGEADLFADSDERRRFDPTLKWNCRHVQTDGSDQLQDCNIDFGPLDAVCDNVRISRRRDDDGLRYYSDGLPACLADVIGPRLPPGLTDYDLPEALRLRIEGCDLENLTTCRLVIETKLDLTRALSATNDLIGDCAKDGEALSAPLKLAIGIDGTLRFDGTEVEAAVKALGKLYETRATCMLRQVASSADEVVNQLAPWLTEFQDKLAGLRDKWAGFECQAVMVDGTLRDCAELLNERLDGSVLTSPPTAVRLSKPFTLYGTQLTATAEFGVREGQLGQGTTVSLTCPGCKKRLDEVAGKLARSISQVSGGLANYESGATLRISGSDITFRAPFSIQSDFLGAPLPFEVKCTLRVAANTKLSCKESGIDPEVVLLTRSEEALNKRLNGVTLPFGPLEVTDLTVVRDDDGKGFKITGQMIFAGLDERLGDVIATIPVLGGSESIIFKPETLEDRLGAVLASQINGVLGSVVPVTVTRVLPEAGSNGKLDRIRISSMAEIGGVFSLTVPDLILSEDGLKADGPSEIGIGFPEGVGIYVPPIAICPTGGAIGPDRLVVRANITVIECASSGLLALKGTGEIYLRTPGIFKHRGDLVVLTVLNVGYVKGELNLRDKFLTSELDIGGPVRDIVQYRSTMRIQGEPPLAHSKDVLKLFRVPVSQQEIIVDLTSPGNISAEMAFDLFSVIRLSGKFSMRPNGSQARADVDGNASIGGFDLASLIVRLRPDYAKAGFRVIGVKLTVVLPGLQTLNPGVLLEMILNLLIPDLKNLDKAILSLLKGNFTFNPMSKFGSGGDGAMDGESKSNGEEGGDGDTGDKAGEEGLGADDPPTGPTAEQPSETSSPTDPSRLNPPGRFHIKMAKVDNLDVGNATIKGKPGWNIDMMEGTKLSKTIASVPQIMTDEPAMAAADLISGAATAQALKVVLKDVPDGIPLNFTDTSYSHMVRTGPQPDAKVDRCKSLPVIDTIYTFTGIDDPKVGFFELCRLEHAGQPVTRELFLSSDWAPLAAPMLHAISQSVGEMPRLSEEEPQSDPPPVPTRALLDGWFGTLSDKSRAMVALLAPGRLLVVSGRQKQPKDQKCTVTPDAKGPGDQIAAWVLFDASMSEALNTTALAAELPPILNALAACSGSLVAVDRPGTATILATGGYVGRRESPGADFVLIREPDEEEKKESMPPSAAAAAAAAAIAAQTPPPAESEKGKPPPPSAEATAAAQREAREVSGGNGVPVANVSPGESYLALKEVDLQTCKAVVVTGEEEDEISKYPKGLGNDTVRTFMDETGCRPKDGFAINVLPNRLMLSIAGDIRDTGQPDPKAPGQTLTVQEYFLGHIGHDKAQVALVQSPDSSEAMFRLARAAMSDGAATDAPIIMEPDLIGFGENHTGATPKGLIMRHAGGTVPRTLYWRGGGTGGSVNLPDGVTEGVNELPAILVGLTSEKTFASVSRPTSAKLLVDGEPARLRLVVDSERSFILDWDSTGDPGASVPSGWRLAARLVERPALREEYRPTVMSNLDELLSARPADASSVDAWTFDFQQLEPVGTALQGDSGQADSVSWKYYEGIETGFAPDFDPMEEPRTVQEEQLCHVIEEFTYHFASKQWNLLVQHLAESEDHLGVAGEEQLRRILAYAAAMDRGDVKVCSRQDDHITRFQTEISEVLENPELQRKVWGAAVSETKTPIETGDARADLAGFMDLTPEVCQDVTADLLTRIGRNNEVIKGRIRVPSASCKAIDLRTGTINLEGAVLLQGGAPDITALSAWTTNKKFEDIVRIEPATEAMPEDYLGAFAGYLEDLRARHPDTLAPARLPLEVQAEKTKIDDTSVWIMRPSGIDELVVFARVAGDVRVIAIEGVSEPVEKFSHLVRFALNSKADTFSFSRSAEGRSYLLATGPATIPQIVTFDKELKPSAMAALAADKTLRTRDLTTLSHLVDAAAQAGHEGYAYSADKAPPRPDVAWAEAALAFRPAPGTPFLLAGSPNGSPLTMAVCAERPLDTATVLGLTRRMLPGFGNPGAGRDTYRELMLGPDGKLTNCASENPDLMRFRQGPAGSGLLHWITPARSLSLGVYAPCRAGDNCPAINPIATRPAIPAGMAERLRSELITGVSSDDDHQLALWESPSDSADRRLLFRWIARGPSPNSGQARQIWLLYAQHTDDEGVCVLPPVPVEMWTDGPADLSADLKAMGTLSGQLADVFGEALAKGCQTAERFRPVIERSIDGGLVIIRQRRVQADPPKRRGSQPDNLRHGILADGTQLAALGEFGPAPQPHPSPAETRLAALSLQVAYFTNNAGQTVAARSVEVIVPDALDRAGRSALFRALEGQLLEEKAEDDTTEPAIEFTFSDDQDLDVLVARRGSDKTLAVLLGANPAALELKMVGRTREELTEIARRMLKDGWGGAELPVWDVSAPGVADKWVALSDPDKRPARCGPAPSSTPEARCVIGPLTNCAGSVSKICKLGDLPKSLDTNRKDAVLDHLSRMPRRFAIALTGKGNLWLEDDAFAGGTKAQFRNLYTDLKGWLKVRSVALPVDALVDPIKEMANGRDEILVSDLGGGKALIGRYEPLVAPDIVLNRLDLHWTANAVRDCKSVRILLTGGGQVETSFADLDAITPAMAFTPDDNCAAKLALYNVEGALIFDWDREGQRAMARGGTAHRLFFTIDSGKTAPGGQQKAAPPAIQAGIDWLVAVLVGGPASAPCAPPRPGALGRILVIDARKPGLGWMALSASGVRMDNRHLALGFPEEIIGNPDWSNMLVRMARAIASRLPANANPMSRCAVPSTPKLNPKTPSLVLELPDIAGTPARTGQGEVTPRQHLLATNGQLEAVELQTFGAQPDPKTWIAALDRMNAAVLRVATGQHAPDAEQINLLQLWSGSSGTTLFRASGGIIRQVGLDRNQIYQEVEVAAAPVVARSGYIAEALEAWQKIKTDVFLAGADSSLRLCRGGDTALRAVGDVRLNMLDIPLWSGGGLAGCMGVNNQAWLDKALEGFPRVAGVRLVFDRDDPNAPTGMLSARPLDPQDSLFVLGRLPGQADSTKCETRLAGRPSARFVRFVLDQPNLICEASIDNGVATAAFDQNAKAHLQAQICPNDSVIASAADAGSKFTHDRKRLSDVLALFEMDVRDCATSHLWMAVQPNGHSEQVFLADSRRLISPKGIADVDIGPLLFARPEKLMTLARWMIRTGRDRPGLSALGKGAVIRVNLPRARTDKGKAHVLINDSGCEARLEYQALGMKLAESPLPDRARTDCTPIRIRFVLSAQPGTERVVDISTEEDVLDCLSKLAATGLEEQCASDVKITAPANPVFNPGGRPVGWQRELLIDVLGQDQVQTRRALAFLAALEEGWQLTEEFSRREAPYGVFATRNKKVRLNLLDGSCREFDRSELDRVLTTYRKRGKRAGEIKVADLLGDLLERYEEIAMNSGQKNVRQVALALRKRFRADPRIALYCQSTHCGGLQWPPNDSWRQTCMSSDSPVNETLLEAVHGGR